MPDSAAVLRIVLSPETRSDIREAARWGREWFGVRAVLRYRVLIEQALRDIASDPERTGSRARPEIAQGIRTYRFVFSRGRAGIEQGNVKALRHLLVCPRRDHAVIDVMRVLHESRDLVRHLQA